MDADNGDDERAAWDGSGEDDKWKACRGADDGFRADTTDDGDGLDTEGDECGGISDCTTDDGDGYDAEADRGGRVSDCTTDDGEWRNSKANADKWWSGGAAIKQPTVISTDAYKWQPGTTSSAIPAAKRGLKPMRRRQRARQPKMRCRAVRRQ